jgi:hypothetical protein
LQEEVLQLATGAVALGCISNRESQHFRLPYGLSEPVAR